MIEVEGLSGICVVEDDDKTGDAMKSSVSSFKANLMADCKPKLPQPPTDDKELPQAPELLLDTGMPPGGGGTRACMCMRIRMYITRHHDRSVQAFWDRPKARETSFRTVPKSLYGTIVVTGAVHSKSPAPTRRTCCGRRNRRVSIPVCRQPTRRTCCRRRNRRVSRAASLLSEAGFLYSHCPARTRRTPHTRAMSCAPA